MSVPVSPTPEPRRRYCGSENGNYDCVLREGHPGSHVSDIGLSWHNPVPSPTPDEQAAEEDEWGLVRSAYPPKDEREQRWRDIFAPHHFDDYLDDAMALADSESADLRAALVVVREQLTQAQARIAAVEALAAELDNSSAGAWDHESEHSGGLSDGLAEAADRLRAVLFSPPTYTTEEPS